jgi:hypothetical protein
LKKKLPALEKKIFLPKQQTNQPYYSSLKPPTTTKKNKKPKKKKSSSCFFFLLNHLFPSIVVRNVFLFIDPINQVQMMV